MLIKTSKATPLQIDWLVATLWWHDEYDQKRIWLHNGVTRILNNSDVAPENRWYYSVEWAPSTDWAQGRLIIDRIMREGLRMAGYKCLPTDPTSCQAQIGNVVTGGTTPLIAAMRCYVVSKLGDTVEVPEELL